MGPPGGGGEPDVVDDPGLVGRGAALALVARLLGPRPSPRVLGLAGEPGIGKSRVAAVAVDHARRRGMGVLIGRASPQDASLPLGVFRDALRTADRAGALPDPDGDALAARFPGWLLPERAGGPADAVARDVLFESAVRFVRAAASEAGLLLVLEDLHHAAPSSCALVAHLAMALDGHPVRILYTFRPDEQGAALRDMRHALTRGRLVAEHPLPPLTPAEVGEMVASLIGRAPSPAACAAIARTAAGNPFAVEEVVREALARRQLDPGTGAWTHDGPVALPWTVREMLVARSRELDHADQELLRLAAVVGERVPTDLLGRSAGLREDRMLSAVGRLVEVGLLRDAGDGSGAVTFRHALVREAILADMLGAERVACHRRVLAALERDGEATSEARLEALLAHAIGAEEPSRAIRYSVRAGRRARVLGAPEEAREHLRRALGLWTPELGDALRAEVLLEDGMASAATGASLAALEALEEARRCALRAGRASLAGTALAEAAGARLDRDERDRVIPDLEHALTEVADAPREVRARAQAILARAHLVTGHPRAARAVAADALALVPPGGVADLDLRITHGAALAGSGEPAAGLAELEAALRHGRDMGDDIAVLRALLTLVGVHVDHLATSAAHADAAVALARRRGLPHLLLRALWRRAATHVEAGEWDRADTVAEEAEGLLPAAPDPVAAMGLLVVRGMRARRLGRVEEATDLFTEVAVDAAARGIWERELEALVGLARTRASAGDPQAGWEALAPAIARWGHMDGGPASPVSALLITGAEMAAVLGDAAGVAELAGRLARRAPGARAEYVAALAAAAAGRPAAPGAVEAAARAIEATGRRPEAARMRMVAAEVLARDPAGRDEAGDLAELAQALYRAMGSEEWGRRADGLLRRLGRRVPVRPARPGGDVLSPREREVLGLIADGLSNRAIAARLVISEATAARHVFNIFTKLGVHTRAQAVAVGVVRPDAAAGYAPPAATDTQSR